MSNVRYLTTYSVLSVPTLAHRLAETVLRRMIFAQISTTRSTTSLQSTGCGPRTTTTTTSSRWPGSRCCQHPSRGPPFGPRLQVQVLQVWAVAARATPARGPSSVFTASRSRAMFSSSGRRVIWWEDTATRQGNPTEQRDGWILVSRNTPFTFAAEKIRYCTCWPPFPDPEGVPFVTRSYYVSWIIVSPLCLLSIDIVPM